MKKMGHPGRIKPDNHALALRKRARKYFEKQNNPLRIEARLRERRRQAIEAIHKSGKPNATRRRLLAKLGKEAQ